MNDDLKQVAEVLAELCEVAWAMDPDPRPPWLEHRDSMRALAAGEPDAPEPRCAACEHVLLSGDYACALYQCERGNQGAREECIDRDYARYQHRHAPDRRCETCGDGPHWDDCRKFVDGECNQHDHWQPRPAPDAGAPTGGDDNESPRAAGESIHARGDVESHPKGGDARPTEPTQAVCSSCGRHLVETANGPECGYCHGHEPAQERPLADEMDEVARSQDATGREGPAHVTRTWADRVRKLEADLARVEGERDEARGIADDRWAHHTKSHLEHHQRLHEEMKRAEAAEAKVAGLKTRLKADAEEHSRTYEKGCEWARRALVAGAKITELSDEVVRWRESYGVGPGDLATECDECGLTGPVLEEHDQQRLCPRCVAEARVVELQSSYDLLSADKGRLLDEWTELDKRAEAAEGKVTDLEESMKHAMSGNAYQAKRLGEYRRRVASLETENTRLSATADHRLALTNSLLADKRHLEARLARAVWELPERYQMETGEPWTREDWAGMVRTLQRQWASRAFETPAKALAAAIEAAEPPGAGLAAPVLPEPPKPYGSWAQWLRHQRHAHGWDSDAQQHAAPCRCQRCADLDRLVDALDGATAEPARIQAPRELAEWFGEWLPKQVSFIPSTRENLEAIRDALDGATGGATQEESAKPATGVLVTEEDIQQALRRADGEPLWDIPYATRYVLKHLPVPDEWVRPTYEDATSAKGRAKGAGDATPASD